MQFPSTQKTYSTTDQLEGKGLRDDLIALAELHDLGAENGGWSSAQVALYLDASLHALRQISPERWAGHCPDCGRRPRTDG